MTPNRAPHSHDLLSLESLNSISAPYYQRFELTAPIDALSILKDISHTPFVYWCSRDGNSEFVGIGLAEPHYSSVSQAQHRLATLPYPLRAFGGCAFSKQSDGWGHFGQERFWIPKIVYGRVQNQYFIQHCILSDQPVQTKPSAQLHPHETIPSLQDWVHHIEASYREFSAGTLKKIVLARQLQLHIPMHPIDALRALRKQQTASFDFAFSPFGTDCFLGCSPELLFSIQGQQIHTEALAGTRPRESNPEELLHSEKDHREHQFVTAHILKQLEPLCQDVHHSPQPMISTHNHVIHLKTKIEGNLHQNSDVAQLIAMLHPTPAVCGLPKNRALQKIEELEGFDRGWYAGPVGWIGKDEAEFAVGIRSALFSKKSYSVWAGAGIVEGSKAQQEWQEIETKSRQFLLLSTEKI